LTVNADRVKWFRIQSKGISDAEVVIKIGTGVFCPLDGTLNEIFEAF
jgi:hypothetical protein